MLSIKLPEELENRINELADKTHQTKTFYVTEAVTRYLDNLVPKDPRKMLIGTDNFDGDYPDEKFYCCGNSPLLLQEEDAQAIADILNKNCHDRFCRVVPSDYKTEGEVYVYQRNNTYE